MDHRSLFYQANVIMLSDAYHVTWRAQPNTNPLGLLVNLNQFNYQHVAKAIRDSGRRPSAIYARDTVHSPSTLLGLLLLMKSLPSVGAIKMTMFLPTSMPDKPRTLKVTEKTIHQ